MLKDEIRNGKRDARERKSTGRRRPWLREEGQWQRKTWTISGVPLEKHQVRREE